MVSQAIAALGRGGLALSARPAPQQETKMQKYQAWQKANGQVDASVKYLEMIGKPAPQTTAQTAGVLHSLSVKTKVHWQKHDGAKNYHDCEDFDRALSEVVQQQFSQLAREAIAQMRRTAGRLLAESKSEVASILQQVEAAEREQAGLPPRAT